MVAIAAVFALHRRGHKGDPDVGTMKEIGSDDVYRQSGQC
jgi:hypothetical protein